MQNTIYATAQVYITHCLATNMHTDIILSVKNDSIHKKYNGAFYEFLCQFKSFHYVELNNLLKFIYLWLSYKLHYFTHRKLLKYTLKTHCGLVTPYGDIKLGQQLIRWRLFAWRHQAITWSNVDLSAVRSIGIHLMANSLEIPQPAFTKISLKITYLILNRNLPGANELKGDKMAYRWQLQMYYRRWKLVRI